MKNNHNLSIACLIISWFIKGNVRSLDRVISGRRYKGKAKKQHIDERGYPKVSLCKDMKSIRADVHRLVADAFIQNPENKREVDHINTVRHDNRVSNLRWVTHKENVNNPITKRRVYIESHKKESLEKAQLTRIKNNRITARKKVYQFTLDGTFVKCYDSAQAAAKENNISVSCIWRVCRHKRGGQSSCGYLWSYTEQCGEYRPYASKYKKLCQYDKEWHLVKIWNSYTEATDVLGINNIARAVKSAKKPIAGGFYWKYL